MRTRAFVHVAGPSKAGKTAFVEAMLESSDTPVIAARCRREDTLTQPRESSPRTHPELRRYRQAGASSAALFRFPGDGGEHDAFFMTELMTDYSEGVVVEGDSPLRFVDLRVFVAPAPGTGGELFVRRPPTEHDRTNTAVLEQVLSEPDGVIDLLDWAGGPVLAQMGRGNEELLESVRSKLLADLRRSGGLRAAKPRARWAVADRYAGIEHAQMVVVNVRHDSDRAAAEQMAADVNRIRKDQELFADILGRRGTRTLVTVAVANVTDREDRGTRKVLARVRRTFGSVSS
jgi:hypothetical protein